MGDDDDEDGGGGGGTVIGSSVVCYFLCVVCVCLGSLGCLARRLVSCLPVLETVPWTSCICLCSLGGRGVAWKGSLILCSFNLDGCTPCPVDLTPLIPPHPVCLSVCLHICLVYELKKERNK